jgi:hypothetical protein
MLSIFSVGILATAPTKAKVPDYKAELNKDSPKTQFERVLIAIPTYLLTYSMEQCSS